MTGEWGILNQNMDMSTNLDETQLSSTVIASGRRLTYREDEIRLPNGVVSRREIIEHPEAVVIVPILAPGKIVLIRQFRTAARKVLLEIPGGLIETGEVPVVAAQRELREETGFRAGSLSPLFDGFPTPGFCTEFMHFFLAQELTEDPLSGDFDEMIDPIVMDVVDALALVGSGGIVDLKTIAALYAVRVLNFG
jgi:ADP-ribose pyrophosphatase